jgi:thiamine biosynthesis protein ThiS
LSEAATDFIKITLNGKLQEIKAGMTVTDLLTKWRMRPELVTVEINESILQKLEYDTTEIKNADKVEFIFYMGGGA